MPKKKNTDCLRARGERLAQYTDQAFRSMCVCEGSWAEWGTAAFAE